MKEATQGIVEAGQDCSGVSPECRGIELGSASCDNTVEE
jgi:hypothetical protein